MNAQEMKKIADQHWKNTFCEKQYESLYQSIEKLISYTASQGEYSVTIGGLVDCITFCSLNIKMYRERLFNNLESAGFKCSVISDNFSFICDDIVISWREDAN